MESLLRNPSKVEYFSAGCQGSTVQFTFQALILELMADGKNYFQSDREMGDKYLKYSVLSQSFVA